jgi:hypothetical protein
MAISQDLEMASKARLAAQSTSTVGLALAQQADFAWLAHAASTGSFGDREPAQLARTLDIVRASLQAGVAA